MVVRKSLAIEVEPPVASPLPTTSTAKTKRMTFLDIPRDVDSILEEQWNDPNYDINGLPSPSASGADSFELEGRRGSNRSTTESDGDSHFGSSKDHSASKFKYHEQEEQVEYESLITLITGQSADCEIQGISIS